MARKEVFISHLDEMDDKRLRHYLREYCGDFGLPTFCHPFTAIWEN
jgi:hypothetical protein